MVSILVGFPPSVTLLCAAKTESLTITRLLQPSKGCTMLLKYPRGSGQASRTDSREDGGAQDSGIRISCSYHLVTETETEQAAGVITFKSNSDEPSTRCVKVTNDM